MKLKIAFGATMLALTMSQPASAALLDFNLTGSRTAMFQLDSMARPDFTNDVLGIFQQIRYNSVAGTYNGVSGFGDVVFSTDGFQILNADLGFSQFISDTSPFAQPLNTPTLLTGTYELRSIVSGRSTLTVTRAAVAAVPEPTSWAMMIVGFGLAGTALRRRKFALSFGPMVRAH